MRVETRLDSLINVSLASHIKLLHFRLGLHIDDVSRYVIVVSGQEGEAPLNEIKKNYRGAKSPRLGWKHSY